MDLPAETLFRSERTWPPITPPGGWPESPLLYSDFRFAVPQSPTDRAQCTVCGEVFSTDTNFARHFPSPTADVCVDPLTVGLIQNDLGVWHQPGSDEATKARRGTAGAVV